jgi:cysteine desulfurase / selenocysteine lyase
MIINKIREDFPVLSKQINGKQIIYLDSACVALKPQQVIDAMNKYYNEFPACGGRSSHKLGKTVTEEVEKAREIIKEFINAKKSSEIIFTKNTTEGINIVLNSFDFKEGDIILTSDKEHNSVLLPVQLLKTRGIRHKTFKFGDITDFKSKIDKNVKLIATAHISNLDGTINPIEEIINLSHKNRSLVLIDAAQSISHVKIDVKKMDIDFLAFSGHKIFGPSGTGVLYGKLDLLNRLKPFVFGGGTVKDSTYEDYVIEDIPQRFEAGLQDYAGIIGLGEAIKYFQSFSIKNVEEHIENLNEIITMEFQKLGIDILGEKDYKKRKGIISFNLKGVHNKEISEILNQNNIFIRAGMHCVHSWFNSNKIDGSARISLSIYNTEEDCRKVVDEIKKIQNLVK